MTEKNLVDGYIELHSIHNRIQRSLVPINGKALSYLFGTTTQSDLRTKWVNIYKLANNQIKKK